MKKLAILIAATEGLTVECEKGAGQDCAGCALKPRCTTAARRFLTRHFHEGALQRMNARVKADPSLMRQRRCAAEHPFGTIKRMTAGGRFLTRGLARVKAEAALSVLAYDGVGVVVFTILVAAAVGTEGVGFGVVQVGQLFFVEALGGAILGLITGYVAYRAMRLIDDYRIEVLIVACGGHGYLCACQQTRPQRPDS